MTDRPAATFGAPRALAALRNGEHGVVELVLSRGMYLRFGEDWLGLSEPGTAFGPLSVVVTGLPGLVDRTPAGSHVQVTGPALLVGDATVTLAGVRERSCVVVRPSAAHVCVSDAETTVRAASRALGAPPERLRAGIELLGSPELSDAVSALAGVGDGLTPAGDDVLAGYAACGFATGRPPGVAGLARGRSSPLGLAYLRAAEHGELPDAGAALLAAVLARSGPRAAAAARGLRSWGASSGAALGWGILAGARPLLGGDAPEG